MRASNGLRALVTAAAVLSVVLAAGCGEREEQIGAIKPDEVALALDFFVNPDHAGVFMALERGYFAEAGLDVEPQVPSDPSAPIKQVAAGRADLAISYEPEVLLARDQGLDVVAVASIVHSPLTSMIWLEGSGVREISDLRGRTIATAGIPYQAAFLEAILRNAGLGPEDVDRVDVGLNLLPAILSGQADALLGAFRNIEGVELARRGKDPTIRPVDALGIPTYNELVLVANAGDIAENPEPIRLFIAALERGTREAAANPARATRAVLEAGQGLDPELTRAEVEATLPLLLPETDKEPYGTMKRSEWREFAAFLADQGLIERLPDLDEALTNGLLPGRVPE